MYNYTIEIFFVIEQEISQYDIEECEHDNEAGATENNDENDIDEETM